MGQRLLLYPTNRLVEPFEVIGILNIFGTDMLQGANEKATRPTGWIKDDAAQFGVGYIYHKLGYGTGGVEFARIACALEVTQNIFVDVVEEMPILHIVEVDLTNAIDDLAHE